MKTKTVKRKHHYCAQAQLGVRDKNENGKAETPLLRASAIMEFPALPGI
jgi:hypothetical protein